MRGRGSLAEAAAEAERESLLSARDSVNSQDSGASAPARQKPVRIKCLDGLRGASTAPAPQPRAPAARPLPNPRGGRVIPPRPASRPRARRPASTAPVQVWRSRS